MKIYRVNCLAVVEIIHAIFANKEHVGKTLDKYLHANKKLGAKDRHFIADHVFKAIRYKRWYLHVYEIEQIETTEQAWTVLAAMMIEANVELPDWFIVNQEQISTIKKRLNESTSHKVKASYTDWFYEQGEQQYGTDWETVADTLNQQAEVCIRVNTLKQTKAALEEKLNELGISVDAVQKLPAALILKSRAKLTNEPLYLNGAFEFQDVSSQEVVEFLELEPGDQVVDGCAGAGGKSLYMAQLMKNKGTIYSLDIHERKLATLEKRAIKAGVKIIQTNTVADSFFSNYDSAIDRVLVDAPCSGSGVIRRNPENKWQLEEEQIQTLSKLQLKILTRNSMLVKRGGIIVYATCSILKQENQDVVHAFLQQQEHFELIDEKSLVPGISTSFDGFYMAKMKRKI